MKNLHSFENTTPISAQAGEAAPASFRCPNCMMGATCGDCPKHDSDGYCRVHGGYTDDDKWACPWYYEH